MITVDDVRRITSTLPRSYEVVVRDQIKFRVGQIVFVAFSRDETVMGVGFPKEERAAMVAAEPDKFMLPRKSDMRYNWIHVRLDAIDLEELRELVIEGGACACRKALRRQSFSRLLGAAAAMTDFARLDLLCASLDISLNNCSFALGIAFFPRPGYRCAVRSDTRAWNCRPSDASPRRCPSSRAVSPRSAPPGPIGLA